MNLSPMTEKLPTYPSNIQGELRLILQTKDIFMACYKQLEAYRSLVNEQNRLITKEFVQEQLQVGEDEITELKMEFVDAENKLASRLRHNELLADQLSAQGFNSAEGPSVRHLALARSPQMRKQMLASRKAANDSACNTSSNTHMIDNIALAIDEIHQEVRTKVKPLLDYYRDLFYLQLHFSLILGQVCNYCMPLVTENIGLLERVFFWAERPEFELIRKASDISDRLKEIYTRAQQIYSILSESVRFLQSKVELQKSLETRFHERMDEQQKIKDKVLRDIHGAKQNMDMLEEENDRLVGSLVKLDPTFVDSQNFIDLAENGVMPTKTTTSTNNQRGADEDGQTNLSNYDDDTNIENSNINANFEFNNNKALSTYGDSDVCARSPTSNKKQVKKIKEKGRKSKTPIDDALRGTSDDEKRICTRTRKREDVRQRKPKRSLTIIGKERAASSGTETRESRQQRKRSTSRTRSPSTPNKTRRRPRHRSGHYDTMSEGLVSEAVSSQKPIQPHSLKSRLLDRTKGLFDLNKLGKKTMQFMSTETDDSSLVVPLEKEQGVTSASSFVSDFPDEFRLRSTRKSRKSKSKKGPSDFEQLPLRDKDLLLMTDQHNENNSGSAHRRRSKSRNSSRKPDHNDLADFLTSSASEGQTFRANSKLPAL